MTSNDLKYTLLAKLPSGEVHQVVISSDQIKIAIAPFMNTVKLLETPLAIDWQDVEEK